MKLQSQQVVKIYTDPFSQTMFEGEAVLIKQVPSSLLGAPPHEVWMVKFGDKEELETRAIATDDEGFNPKKKIMELTEIRVGDVYQATLNIEFRADDVRAVDVMVRVVSITSNQTVEVVLLCDPSGWSIPGKSSLASPASTPANSKSAKPVTLTGYDARGWPVITKKSTDTSTIPRVVEDVAQAVNVLSDRDKAVREGAERLINELPNNRTLYAALKSLLYLLAGRNV